SAELFQRLRAYLERLEFPAGQYLFTQGDQADSLYLLQTGRVSVLYEGADGAELRLRSMVGPTVLGEMGLYRSHPRGASVKVDKACIAFRLSHASLQTMEEGDPSVAYAFHKFIVRILASRLDLANREIAGLQN